MVSFGRSALDRFPSGDRGRHLTQLLGESVNRLGELARVGRRQFVVGNEAFTAAVRRQGSVNLDETPLDSWASSRSSPLTRRRRLIGVNGS
jgi:hypothetical protein